MFAQTTHVVAAPHGFACVVIPATRLYISSFIEIRSGVSEPRGVKIWPFPLLWLVAFTTACTNLQAVTLLFCQFWWLRYLRDVQKSYCVWNCLLKHESRWSIQGSAAVRLADRGQFLAGEQTNEDDMPLFARYSKVLANVRHSVVMELKPPVSVSV